MGIQSAPLLRLIRKKSLRARVRWMTSSWSPTSAFQQAEICEAFREVVLWLLSVENIFDFSQTTFNLALTIFSRLIVSVKVGEL